MTFLIIAYTIIIYFFGPTNIIYNLKSIHLSSFIIALFLVVFSIFFEFLRWSFYLRVSGTSLKLSKSLSIFLSGFVFAFLPSQSADLVRYYFLKKENVSLTKIVPIHFVAHATDFIVVFLCATPILWILGKQKIFLVTISLVFLLYVSFRKPLFYLKLLKVIKARTQLGFIKHLEKILAYSEKLLNLRALLLSFTLTLLYHSTLLAILFFLLEGLSDVSPLLVFSIVSLSLILGALSMLPGGVIVVEGGSIALLSLFIDPVTAATLILVIRFLTLWAPGFIGLPFLIKILRSKPFKKKILNKA